MISIIVPAYNAESYLPACLDSVLEQTYQDYELLLVDDGSTDTTLVVAEQYASRDRRIRILPSAKTHAWAARNLGIEKARGAYITFLDADDTLHPQALELLLEAAIRYRATTVMAGYYDNQRPGSDLFFPCPLKAPMHRVMGGRTALRAFIRGALRDTVWGTLYARDVFATVRFEDRPCHEDAFFVPRALSESERTVVIPSCLYYYRRHEGSITRTMSPCRINSPAARLYVYSLARKTYRSRRLWAVAAGGVIGAATSLALKAEQQTLEPALWRRRIYTVLPRCRILLFCCNPLLSHRTRVMGIFLITGFGRNARFYRRIRSLGAWASKAAVS